MDESVNNSANKLIKCWVKDCMNSSETIPKKHFFHAPSNFGDRGLWIFATGKNYKHTSKIVVCQDHFDMKKDVVDIFLKEGHKPLLKKGTIPHLNLGENGQSAAGRTSTTVNIFNVDRGCQTNFVDNCCGCNGTKRKKVDASTTTDTAEESTDNSSNPVESSGSVYVPDTDEDEYGTDDDNDLQDDEDVTEDELDEDFSENDDDDNVKGLDSAEKKMMCDLTIKIMRKNIQHYTSIPESSAYIINLILERELMSERDLFLVLRKIRHDETLQILGDLFGISRWRAGQIFVKCIEMYLKAFVYWPSSTDVKLNLPLQFKHRFKKVESLFDCFETSVAKPSHPVDQALTWSQYKHANTLKHLISSTPDGMINYRSIYSDNEIVKRSGFLNNIKGGTETMADRGFKDVKPEIESRGGILHKPPSTQAGLRYTKEEAKFCKSVAATRIHIERVIKKLRDFEFLTPHRASIPSKRTYLIEYALTVSSAICNMQSYLTKI